MPPAVIPSPAATSATTPRNAQGALNFFWFVFWFFIAIIAIGLTWDRRWHTTHVFDTFYSPPHLFTYTMSAVSAVLVGIITFLPNLRRWFGPTIRVFPFRFPVPAALFITGAGFVTLAIAGILDDIWHTTFGLDETGWSTPHAMIGWGLFMVMCGFVACRLALAEHQPLGWGAGLAMAFGMLYFSHTPFLGPLANNISSDTVRAIYSLPILQVQPAAQHTARIYESWNLTHTNPLYVLFSAFWAGALLVLLHRLDRRAWIFWAVLIFFSATQVLSDVSTYVGLERYVHTIFADRAAVALPVPILPAALIWRGLEVIKVPRPWALAAAGLVLGILGVGAWDAGRGLVVLALLAAPLLLLGGLTGEGIWRVLRRPFAGRHPYFVVLGITVPLLTGIIDLALRTVTP